MEDIFRSLPKILRENDEAKALLGPLVFAAWKRIAGESLQKHAEATKLEEKRLSVAVADDMWRTHLTSLSGQMIFQLNSLLGAETVTFIEFYVDNALFTEKRMIELRKKWDAELFETRSRHAITPAILKAADGIEDERMRELFLQAAGNCLVRKEDLYG